MIYKLQTTMQTDGAIFSSGDLPDSILISKRDDTEIMALKNFPITSSMVPVFHPKAGSADLLMQKHDLLCASALTQTELLGKPTDLKCFAMPCIV